MYTKDKGGMAMKFNSSKSRIKRNCLSFLSVILLIIIMISGCVLASSKSNSKTVYVSILNDLAQKSRSGMEKLQLLERKPGKFSYTSNNKEVENFEIYLKERDYLLKTDNFKALYDDANSEIYAKKIENGKEIGDTLVCKYNDVGYYNFQKVIQVLKE